METHKNEVHLETDQARGACEPHVGRYVLTIGISLAIAALSAIWITGALTH